MAKVSHLVLPVLDVQRSRDWYVGHLGFTFDRERGGTVGIRDDAGLVIFLQKAAGTLAGPKLTVTIQVGNVDRLYEDLVQRGVAFVHPPQRLPWGYGAEVLDPDGYINHLWDEVTMSKARG